MSAGECPFGAKVVDYFDHNSREYVDKRHAWYQQIRRDIGPVFWSPNYGGYWVVIGFAELEAAARDWETFSSKHVLDADGRARPLDGLRYEGLFVPPRPYSSILLEEDPPAWERSRQALAATFSLPAAERWRGRLQDLVDACLDRKIESGAIDFAKDISNIVPAILSLELAGVPTDHYQLVARNHHLTSHIPAGSPQLLELADDLAFERAQVVKAVEDHKTGERGRDVISVLLNARDKGTADFTDDEILALANLVIGAGIDTTASVLCNALQILTKRPDLRKTLMEDPSLTVTAFEEFLRISAPTQGLCRTVTRDVELGGQNLRRGDRVMLCFAAACRDPREFDKAEEVVLERKPNLHVALGSGTHRCLGQFYARLEFETILNTVLRRMPDFQVDLDAVKSFENVGVVTGFTSVPATFTPGAKLGVDPKVPGFFAGA